MTKLYRLDSHFSFSLSVLYCFAHCFLLIWLELNLAKMEWVQYISWIANFEIWPKEYIKAAKFCENCQSTDLQKKSMQK